MIKSCGYVFVINFGSTVEGNGAVSALGLLFTRKVVDGLPEYMCIGLVIKILVYFILP